MGEYEGIIDQFLKKKCSIIFISTHELNVPKKRNYSREKQFNTQRKRETVEEQSSLSATVTGAATGAGAL